MGKSGDFTYASAAFEAAQEYNQDERTATQRAADKAKRAPVTTDYQRWKSDPSGLDFPGVDTPSASPEVLPKDLKQSQKPELSARAQNEAPAEAVQTTTRDLERQELSRTDISLAPDEAFEGVGSETSEAAFFGSGSRVDEQRRLESGDPPDIARGEDPFDMSSDGAGESEREEFNFPEWTVSRAGTYLNKKVNFEGRDDLEPLRQRVNSARTQDGRIELDREEYDTFQRVVREGAESELESLEGREANIFGDAEEQREIAREAKQGIINNPPSRLL